jgi:hypothetical protein
MLKKMLTCVAVVSLFFTVACSDGVIENEEVKPAEFNRQSNEIVGGSIYEGMPAVGALAYNGSMHCTGTLVTPRKVVTAGHCVSGFSASKMQFVIGNSLSQAQYVLNVASIEAHPGYNGSSITNDIGLVTLTQDAPVAPMGIVRSMDSSWVGKSLFFVGYGVDNGYNQTGSGIKRAVWMAISSLASTSFRYDSANKNTCNGDSGGPAFVQDANGDYLVAGVTSYGDYYCTSYGVDTRVDAYLDFLGISGEDPVDDPEDPEDDPVDPCQGETFVGRCVGETVIWCENDQIQQQDCIESSKECGFSQEHQYYACVEPEVVEPEDPCQGETYAGRCEDNSVIWCENEQVQSEDCAASDKVCVFDASKQYYACREPEVVDPCNGETFEGRCDGGTVIWCENEEINSLDCGAKGRDCGYNSSKGYYDCL